MLDPANDLDPRQPVAHLHSHTLSVNSVGSLPEPPTPPTGRVWEEKQLQPLELPVQRHKVDKDYLAMVAKVPLAQLRPSILQLARDQYGCRFLQKRIDENVVVLPAARTANFELIFAEVLPVLPELIVDPFGNYLVQRLIDYCTSANVDVIMEMLQHNLFAISVNQHGTRALQKVIDRMDNERQLALLTVGLQPYIVDLIKDLNGNHVIQKILNKYPPEKCQFIYTAIIKDLLVLATHKHGCCVLQKCLNHVNAQQLEAFANKILLYDVFANLINNQFGNYVLQYLVLIDSAQVNQRLFAHFVRFGITGLCTQKFSLNVVEKLMKNCYKNETVLLEYSSLKFALMHAILASNLNKLINDPFGNYVIQTLIDVAVHPDVSYVHNGHLLPGLRALLPENHRSCGDSLQIQMIKHWFQSCKIVSLFGKRIQLKINVILKGTTRSRQPLYIHFGPHQNMHADGEFVNFDASVLAQQTRRLSLESQPNRQYPVYELNSLQQPFQYRADHKYPLHQYQPFQNPTQNQAPYAPSLFVQTLYHPSDDYAYMGHNRTLSASSMGSVASRRHSGYGPYLLFDAGDMTLHTARSQPGAVPYSDSSFTSVEDLLWASPESRLPQRLLKLAFGTYSSLSQPKAGLFSQQYPYTPNEALFFSK